LNASAPDILETPDFNPINLVAQYHQLEVEFTEWAARTGGSVIEFHCYTWSKYLPPSRDDQVWDMISPTVKKIYPEIFDRDFKVLDLHVNSFQNFASFEQGLINYRPYTDSLDKLFLKNVFVAGDWVRTPFPSALMERAVSTGRLAANEVLIRDKVRQVPLTVVNPKGPGFGL
jgi:isorenieratene synthase